MGKIKSARLSEVDVSKYSNQFDDGILSRIAHAIQREVPGAEIKIDEASMEVKQDLIFVPQD